MLYRGRGPGTGDYSGYYRTGKAEDGTGKGERGDPGEGPGSNKQADVRGPGNSGTTWRDDGGEQDAAP